jgi:site-specific DNA recombinase
MEAAIYARVSSEKQAEKDLSIPAQLKALRRYTLERGWNIVDEYVDEAESARSASRPAFQDMIAAVKKKEKPFDIILVWKLSRFARNREDSIIYKSLLRKRGISVISINEKIDDTAAGRLLEGMIEVIDEFYSVNLAQDTMRGMKENVNRGFFNGGLVPFGYRKIEFSVGGSHKTKLEPDEVEAPIVKRAFQMALDGKGGKEIAQMLNADGFRTRAGKLFGTTIINYWLRNPVYTGTLVWNRTDRTGYKAVRKSDGEVIFSHNAHQSLVSSEDFQRVQRLLSTGVLWLDTLEWFQAHIF